MSVRNYKVTPCTRRQIAAFIVQWHYSKNVNGIISDICFRLDDENGNLIGAMIYGKVAMAGVWKKYAEREEDLLELRRLCCVDNTPKNTESYFIGATLRYLKKHTKIKTIISYADTTYHHEGIIYKASNFTHIGMTSSGSVIIHNGKQYHDKTVRTTHNGKIKPYAVKLSQALSVGEAHYQDTKPKHIYIYYLKK